MDIYDFSGWATRNNLKCSDGRVIMRDAFKDNDGKKVPLVWNHCHNEPFNVLGHALLENREEGVYAYCTFNDTDSGVQAKNLVEHGDVSALSIYANQLKQQGSNVVHGAIREVSLVLAGANPGAFIDSVIKHGETSDEEAIIYTGENIAFYKEDGKSFEHSSDDKNDSDEDKDGEEDNSDKKETVRDMFNNFTEEQKNLVYSFVEQALSEENYKDEDEEDDNVKHNVFENDTQNTHDEVLSHSDQESIIALAKNKSCGSLQNAIQIYAEENNSLSHGIDDIESLFPEYKDVRPGAPEMITRDQTWVNAVINGVHKSPISRIRTRQADVRGDELRAYGYQKGKYKRYPGNIKLLKRTTDPQTVFVRDALHRDDIIDITDFDVVSYQYSIMRQNLNEELAMAIMIGDGRDEGDELKIQDNHIRPIWTDDELYTIHYDVDIEGMTSSIQGTNTGANFGENYIYAEAIIQAALYSREKYKGSGSLAFYCTPHLLNVMLLARDLNGRRIYSSVTDLTAALNVSAIHTAEQFEGKVRTTDDSRKKKLLGLFVNLNDYSLGSTKGGEITRFNQFDIDFNQEKYLLETRVSGALTRVMSAIALEEDVTE
jgi:HK97 family phage prohead protease